MTSRPYAGVGTQRQPQRSANGTAIVTRPTPQRAPSHQHQPSALGRKQDKYIDLDFGGSLVGNDLYGPGSDASPRLKCESSAPSRALPSGLAESSRSKSSASQKPRGHPSLRFGNAAGIPKSENVILHSPAAERTSALSKSSPMPMPGRPTSHRSATALKERIITANILKKDTRPKPYVPEVPLAAPRYPANGSFPRYDATGNTDFMQDMQTTIFGQDRNPKISLPIKSYVRVIMTRCSPHIMNPHPQRLQYCRVSSTKVACILSRFFSLISWNSAGETDWSPQARHSNRHLELL